MQHNKFTDSLNTAVFTSKYILNDKKPILFVYHYKDDGAWEFVGDEILNDHDYTVASLDEIIQIDHSVLEVASMYLGYYARRDKVGGKWIIDKM